MVDVVGVDGVGLRVGIGLELDDGDAVPLGAAGRTSNLVRRSFLAVMGLSRVTRTRVSKPAPLALFSTAFALCHASEPGSWYWISKPRTLLGLTSTPRFSNSTSTNWIFAGLLSSAAIQVSSFLAGVVLPLDQRVPRSPSIALLASSAGLSSSRPLADAVAPIRWFTSRACATSPAARALAGNQAEHSSAPASASGIHLPLLSLRECSLIMARVSFQRRVVHQT